MRSITHRATCLVFVSALVVGWLPAAERSALRLRAPLLKDADARPIAKPRLRSESELYAIVYNSWFRHLGTEGKIGKSESLNVNAWDEVPDSTWFTNRMGRHTLSWDQILSAFPDTGPAPGRWTIRNLIGQGYTPKFGIVDSQGRRYVLKFDLPDRLERNSGAERICTLIMFAVGFNVPQNSIVRFERGQLVLSEKSYYEDPLGKRRPLTQKDLDKGLDRLKTMPDGTYRGLASLFLQGEDLGPFFYTGRREDDPNDLIPHEFRRELRGLRVIASWINHADVKDANANDFFIPDKNGTGFVRHYFWDFGSTLGSGDFLNGPYRVGYEYLFDGSAIGRSFLSLGTWRRPWAEGHIRFPEIGWYEAELFDPAKWKPNYPNLAFLQTDDGDAYWGAKIVTAFSDELLRRLVNEGRYSRPEVTDHLFDVMRARRDAIGRYWLNRVTPLDDMALAAEGTSYRLTFRDLAAERGYTEVTRPYRFRLSELNGKVLVPWQECNSSGLAFPASLVPSRTWRRGGQDRFHRVPILRVSIASRNGNGWSLPIEVILGYGRVSPSLAVLGWQHARRG